MNILMIAPEPFFEPRGTPFSEYFRIKALGHLGHNIDLVTYPLGQDKDMKGLRIFRSMKIPFIKSVKTGPSKSKILLDFFLFFKALFRLLAGKYDVIHTHEEACLMGALFNKLTKTPHLYDMHSSLVQQMENFQYTKSKIITGLFKWVERTSLKNAASVIVICRSLYDYASTITDKDKLTIIENFIDDAPPPSELNPQQLETIRNTIGSNEKKIILYAGTLEKYQGIPLLLDALTHLPDDFRLVLIGGKEKQINDVRQDLETKGLTDRVLLLGSKQPEDIPYYLEAADMLVSPRISGTNIPLKVYSYLKSGKPLVATNLYTHTQSISPDIAILVEPNAESFATGIKEAASEKGKQTAHNAKKFCQENYNFQRYLELVSTALEKSREKN